MKKTFILIMGLSFLFLIFEIIAFTWKDMHMNFVINFPLLLAHLAWVIPSLIFYWFLAFYYPANYYFFFEENNGKLDPSVSCPKGRVLITNVVIIGFVWICWGVYYLMMHAGEPIVQTLK